MFFEMVELQKWLKFDFYFDSDSDFQFNFIWKKYFYLHFIFIFLDYWIRRKTFIIDNFNFESLYLLKMDSIIVNSSKSKNIRVSFKPGHFKEKST